MTRQLAELDREVASVPLFQVLGQSFISGAQTGTVLLIRLAVSVEKLPGNLRTRKSRSGWRGYGMCQDDKIVGSATHTQYDE